MIVDSVTCTISANSPEYVFEVSLSQLGMHRLKHKQLLGGCVELPKLKYEFLNDLAAALAEEIVNHLEKMDRQ